MVRVLTQAKLVTARKWGKKKMEVEILETRVRDGNTEIIATAAGLDLKNALDRKCSRRAELIVFDGRFITPDQRKKIYAMLNDISSWTGYYPEETKERMKYLYIEKTGMEMFSLSTCEVDVARQFLNIIIDFSLENGIPLRETALERTDDIYHYLVSCIIHKRCCICGKPADIHHVDAIGMGNNRLHYDDSGNEIIALCRAHHGIAHNKGNLEFFRQYHVFGIKKFEVEPSYTGMFD